MLVVCALDEEATLNHMKKISSRKFLILEIKLESLNQLQCGWGARGYIPEAVSDLSIYVTAVLFLQVGDEVWVKKCITEPAGGWAGVKHNSVGTLLSVNGEDVVVNFTECKEWRGLLTELEKVRPISIGDKVKVRKHKLC